MNSFQQHHTTVLRHPENIDPRSFVDFEKILVNKLVAYSADLDDEGIEKAAEVRAKMDNVKDIMLDNISRIVEQGEKLDVIVDRSEELSLTSNRFKSRSTDLKRHMFWKDVKCKAFLCCVVSVVILVVYIITCDSCFGNN